MLKRLDGPLDDTVPAKRPITVRDLLTFRMGFGQIMAPPDAYPILSAANAQQIGMGPPSPSMMPAPAFPSGAGDWSRPSTTIWPLVR